MIDRALNECGAGRSILIDERGQILAGNATTDAAQAAGLKLQIVDTDGDTIVAVRRRDLTPEQKVRIEGSGRLSGRKVTTIFHTSHPGLCAALRRDPNWRQVSAHLYGGNKKKSAASMARSGGTIRAGYGGHFRAVQGFRYVGGLL